MWHCANIVCEPEGSAAGVLLRAAALVSSSGETGESAQLARLSGPGLLARGLQLDRRHDQMPVHCGPPPARITLKGEEAELGRVYLYRPAGLETPPLSWTTRVGFSFQDTYPWRCFWSGHPAVGKISLKPLLRKRTSKAKDKQRD
jgi:3-methyladenine DNA glycosylase Mpg